MLPSFYKTSDPDRAWNVAHAAGYGAIIGVLAATFKTLGPLRPSAAANLFGNLTEIAVAAIAFSSLCVAAAMLRNYLFRRMADRDGW
jgi:hypothetical protein